MTCTLTRPSPQDLYTRVKTNFEVTVLGGAPVIPESIESYVVSCDYAAAEEFYSISAAQWRENDPRYACCDNLTTMAALDGVYPRTAGFAQGYIKVTGTSGATVPTPLNVTFGSQSYKTVGTVPTTMPSSGYFIAQVKAIVAGASGNSATGNGTLTTTVSGIDSVVTAYGDKFCGGSIAEDCETFRTRYLARKAFQPKATNAWLQQKIAEWPCVTRVFERGGSCNTCDDTANCGNQTDCGCNSCQGKLNFYALFDGTFDCGLAPQNVIDDLNNWLFGVPVGAGKGQVEIGVCGAVHTAKPLIVNVFIDGLTCANPIDTQEIKSRIADLFLRTSPSTMMLRRQIELVIVQVVGASILTNQGDELYTNQPVGSSQTLRVDFEIVSGNGSVSSCGDLIPDCDYMPCLNSITFASGRIKNSECT